MHTIPPPEASAPPAPPPVIRVPAGYRLCPRCGGRGHVSNATICWVCQRTGVGPVAVRLAA